MAKLQLAQNNEMLALLLQHTVSANKTHKSLRPIVNPGHSVMWATADLDFAALMGMRTSLSAVEVFQAIPMNTMAMEQSQSAVSANRLLSGFCALVLNLPSPSAPVSAIDFASAHVSLLFKLVKAYGAVPDCLAMDAAAAEAVYSALEWCGSAAANAGATKLRVAWLTAKGSPVPTSPKPLFMAIARAYLPVDNWQSKDADYKEYLGNHYNMQSPESLPSFVFNAAINLARNRHEVNSSGHVRETKELFVAWARQAARRDSSIAPLMEPLLQLFQQPYFFDCSLAGFHAQIERLEAEGNLLHPLVSSLPPAAATAKPPPRRLAVNSIPGVDGGIPDAPAEPVVATLSYADVHDMIVASLSAAGRPLSAPAPAPAPTPAALNKAGVQSMINAAVAQVRAAQSAVAMAPVLAAQPSAVTAVEVQAMIAASNVHSMAASPAQGPSAPAGLHPAMSAFFSPPAVFSLALAPGFTLKDDPALMVSTMVMDDGWLTLHGCKDLAAAPSAPSKDRIVLNVKAICEACVIPLPAGLDVSDNRQIGGPECPFCYVLGALRGLPPLEFHVHPQDAVQRRLPVPPPKPKLAHHRYIHRIAKCPAGAAIAHRLVRLDRDAGRTVRAELLAPVA